MGAKAGVRGALRRPAGQGATDVAQVAAFLAIGGLIGLIGGWGWVRRPGPGEGQAALLGGLAGGAIGGWLLYHGDAANHHRFLSLVSATAVAALAAAAARSGRSRLTPRARRTRGVRRGRRRGERTPR